jgi:hypothetical protein
VTGILTALSVFVFAAIVFSALRIAARTPGRFAPSPTLWKRATSLQFQALQKHILTEGPNIAGARQRNAQMDQRFRVLSVPADGTSAATEGNGDFGTSPIFGQLSGKPLLACSL